MAKKDKYTCPRCGFNSNNKNHMRNHFYNLKKIIAKSEKLDRFYRFKYLKYAFQFSYIYYFFKNFSYNFFFFIIYAKHLFKKKLYKNDFQENVFSLIMEHDSFELNK